MSQPLVGIGELGLCLGGRLRRQVDSWVDPFGEEKVRAGSFVRCWHRVTVYKSQDTGLWSMGGGPGLEPLGC